MEEKEMEQSEMLSEAKEKEGRKRHLHSAKEYFPQAIAAFFVIAAAILLYFLLLRIRVIGDGIRAVLSVMSPIICGFVIAFLLSPAVRMLERKMYGAWSKSTRGKKATKEKVRKAKRVTRNVSIFISLAVTITLLTLLVVAIIPELISSIETLMNNLPRYADAAIDLLNRFLAKNERLSELVMPYLKNATHIMEEWLSGKLSLIVSTTYDWLTYGMKALIDVVFTLLIGIIISAYLMGSKEYYIGLCKKLIFAIFRKDHAKTLVQTMHKANIIYSSAIIGKIVDSIIIGLLCFIGTTILGLFFDMIGEYSILVSIVVGVTNVIPFFGPFIGGIPCTVLIMCMNPVHGVIFGLFLVVLQQFDCNYLDPHIVGKRVGLRPIFVLCACLVLGGLGGIPGMLLATPTFALVYTIMKAYFEVRLERKNLPKETVEYIQTPGAVLVRNSMKCESTNDETMKDA